MQTPKGSAPAANGRPHGSGISHPLVNGGAIHVEQPDDEPATLVIHKSASVGTTEAGTTYRLERASRMHEGLVALAGGPSHRLSAVEKLLLVLLALFMAWVTYQVVSLAAADHQARLYEQEAAR